MSMTYVETIREISNFLNQTGIRQYCQEVCHGGCCFGAKTCETVKQHNLNLAPNNRSKKLKRARTNRCGSVLGCSGYFCSRLTEISSIGKISEHVIKCMFEIEKTEAKLRYKKYGTIHWTRTKPYDYNGGWWRIPRSEILSTLRFPDFALTDQDIQDTISELKELTDHGFLKSGNATYTKKQKGEQAMTKNGTYRFVVFVDVSADSLEGAYQRLTTRMNDKDWESIEEAYYPDGEQIDPDWLQETIDKVFNLKYQNEPKQQMSKPKDNIRRWSIEKFPGIDNIKYMTHSINGEWVTYQDHLLSHENHSSKNSHETSDIQSTGPMRGDKFLLPNTNLTKCEYYGKVPVNIYGTITGFFVGDGPGKNGLIITLPDGSTQTIPYQRKITYTGVAPILTKTGEFQYWVVSIDP